MPIKQLKTFRKGMSPFINQDGIARLEHFDTTTDQLRPYRGLVASSAPTYEWISKFVKASGSLYALCRDDSLHYPSILQWNTSTFAWEIYQSMGATGAFADAFHYYSGHFIGLWKGTHLWRIVSGVIDQTWAAKTYTNYTDFITHTKDGLCYFGTDNVLNSYNGTAISVGVTFPSTYRLTSIAEQGDYIMVVGYDTVSGRSTAYLWDRDSSLATLTGKYDLGEETVYHNATLAGVAFSVSLKGDTANSNFNEKPRLIIRYQNGDKFTIKSEYQFSSLSIGGKYVDNNKLYFNAYIKFLGESAGHWVVFQLDENGNLAIAQNVGINDAGGSLAEHPGIIRDGDAFWIGGRQDGAWNTSTTYSTTSIIETNKYSADNLTRNLDTVGFAVSFEPLPAGASVVVKTRRDEETAWTTVATYDTDNEVKGSSVGGDITTAKTRQFRIESTGGAVINAFQADFEEKNNERYN